MTPFGIHLQKLRRERNISQKEMALALGVSPAYLSALEHGQRGKPNWAMLQRIVGFLNVIWDDAEKLQELALLSDPKVTIDTSGQSAQATQTANLLARHIHELDDADLERLADNIRKLAKESRSEKL